MVRTFVCAALALLFTAGLVVAQEKKEKKNRNFARGVVKKIDAASSTITVTVKTKDSMEDKEFKIGDNVKFVIFKGDERTELSAKDGLKAEQLKEGAQIGLQMNEKKEVTTVTLGMRPKKKDK